MLNTHTKVVITVRGRVQGVFFRHSARIRGEKLGLVGTIENLPDESVSITAEGERAKLEELIAYCRKGPPLARVDAIELTWGEPSGEFKRFEIK